MSIRIHLLPVLIVSIVLSANAVYAIPMFAKKYKRSCNMCHSYVPKLNRFGERFKLHGYQLPGTIDNTPVWENSGPPLSVMVHAMYSAREMKNSDNKASRKVRAGEMKKSSGFNSSSLELLSGGTLSNRLSYFVGFEVDMENGKAEMEVQKAFGVYNLYTGTWGALNLRLGQFALMLPLSGTETFGANIEPITVYEAAPARLGQGFNMRNSQLGLAAFGLIGENIPFEIAVVNGNNARKDNNNNRDGFVRIARDVGPHRVGMFYYRGFEAGESRFYRYGLDLSLELRLAKIPINPFVQLMKGHDDDIAEKYNYLIPRLFNFRGGFFGLEIGIVPEKLVLYIRYDYVEILKEYASELEENVTIATYRDLGLVKRPTAFQETKVAGGMLGFAYYFAPNVYMIVHYARKDNELTPIAVNKAAATVTGGSGTTVASASVSDKTYGVLDVDMEKFMFSFVYVF